MGAASDAPIVASAATRAATLAEIEERRFTRALHVPTEDADVRRALRERGAVPTQPGEDAHDRRERLRALMAREALAAGASNPPPSAPVAPAATTVPNAPPNEEYWTKGTAALPDTRVRLTLASLAAAARRLDRERAERAEYIEETNGTKESMDTSASLRRERAEQESKAVESVRSLALRTSERAEGRPLSAVSLHDGVVATGCWAGNITFWDAVSCAKQHTVQAHEARVSMLEMPAPGVVLSAGADGQACLLRDGDSQAIEVAHRYTGHEGRVSAVRMHPHVGDVVATAGFDGTLRIHADVETLAVHHTGHRAVTWTSWHPDGALLATTGSEGGLRLWDVRSGRAVLTMERLHADKALRVAFSGDGRLMASGGADNAVVVADLRKQRAIKKIAAHTKVVSALQFGGGVASSDILMSAGFDGVVKLWAVRRDLALVKALTAHEDKVVSVAADNDCSTVVTACYDRTWKVWVP